MTRPLSFLIMAVTGLMTILLCCPAHAAQAWSGDARLRGRPLTMLAFSEETLPAQDAPSPGASPGAGVSPDAAASPAASGETAGPNAGWERVHNGAGGGPPG
jgi:hypothetical protein